MKTFNCPKCSKPLELEYKISFREDCPHCLSDLHTCLNCQFYDPSSYNECKEPLAEKVKDKEKNNICEYFSLNTKNQQPLDDQKKHLKEAENLFKK